MYQVLYRKWRPQYFKDVVGQEHITTALKNELVSQRINHAYLFTGCRGTGKTTCAKILAKAVNCLNSQNGDPCGQCENCRDFAEGKLYDVVEIDAASNTGVDNIRTIIEEAMQLPSNPNVKYRVYIIDEVHMLSGGAFNALLKTLEEPPAHVLFILATTEVHKLPATILSRCQRFDFHRISPENMSQRLCYIAQQEGASLSVDAALLIASVADGAFRDALSILDRCIGTSLEITEQVVREVSGLANRDYLFSLGNSLKERECAEALITIDKLYKDSKDMAQLCRELISYFRNLMLIKTLKEPRELLVMSNEEYSQSQQQARYISLGEIIYAMDVLQIACDRMSRGNNSRTELEMALIKICSPEMSQDLQSILDRLSSLERKLRNGVTVTAESKPTTTEQPIENYTVPESVPSDTQQQSKPIVTNPTQERARVHSSASLEEIMKSCVPMLQWQEVLDVVKKESRSVATAFAKTNAYTSGDYLLIESDSELPFSMLKSQHQREAMRSAIKEVTGRVYKLGPYKPTGDKAKEKTDPLKSLAEKLESGGVEVTTE
ncbi:MULTISPECIES: DNA polymerase III subunit gamma/tau [unclassified Ruminococcus]|uniref:DNA polymerase III subunit gamma/tau n=1 Tax=unclassified Ruminococcus TaxID=2608920 RepID=UPI00210A0F7F|nr:MULTISPECIES: DNA polymerase III subunit gamma/tau [unclassified Ruminococcus]MCQ4022953.1 DNA polymerase III subunit gamma/tau [Ruminococcus sp. zg-924]MCQ4115349.1 DNA polymerase III subunit gamma/tau [Ruminococcus sp. zg-921]